MTSEDDVNALRAVLQEKNCDTFILIYEIEEIPCRTDLLNRSEPAKRRDINRLVSLLKTPQGKKMIKSRCRRNVCRIQFFQHVSIGEHQLPPIEVWIALEQLVDDNIKALTNSLQEKIQHD